MYILPSCKSLCQARNFSFFCTAPEQTFDPAPRPPAHGTPVSVPPSRCSGASGANKSFSINIANLELTPHNYRRLGRPAGNNCLPARFPHP
ncbi:hypothetical protein FVE85_8606 [Porphyridium purpureum]|uniref:Uncharacterized protein n=1 Tax=Porphyridium purpureum TaxID=35688 RepID=A0A5J4YNQ4_PORPP|nr:hypothetical protein FVE85_8606 [Porphyridium purpureum]|eukprot:POR7298..scf296_7